MSECVVRMELPKACWSCGLRFVCKAANDFLTTKEAGCSVLKAGMPGCLIICQLPEGHGRLVDKDEVIESIRTEVTELFFNGLKGTPRPDGDLRFMWNRLEDEDFAPTIVPAEAERSET